LSPFFFLFRCPFSLGAQCAMLLNARLFRVFRLFLPSVLLDSDYPRVHRDASAVVFELPTFFVSSFLLEALRYCSGAVLLFPFPAFSFPSALSRATRGFFLHERIPRPLCPACPPQFFSPPFQHALSLSPLPTFGDRFFFRLYLFFACKSSFPFPLLKFFFSPPSPVFSPVHEIVLMLTHPLSSIFLRFLTLSVFFMPFPPRHTPSFFWPPAPFFFVFSALSSKRLSQSPSPNQRPSSQPPTSPLPFCTLSGTLFQPRTIRFP